MTTSKIILMGVIVVAGLATSLQIQRRAQAELRENESVLRQRDDQLTELAVENHRLANLVARTKTNGTTARDRTTELARLRAEAESLRRQTNQLAKQLTENRRLSGVRFFSQGDFDLLEHNKTIAASFGGGPRATGKLNDARAITAALRKYATENQGNFPWNLGQAEAYLPKALEADSSPGSDAPLTGTNNFEIVYQGSQNDLTNIPLRRVALIRERQPWLTPDGKWARVYGYADGAAEMVESDDDFQSWDAQHIIPPQSAEQ